jgi:hypothetical protein
MLNGSPRFNNPVVMNSKSLCLRTVVQFVVKGDRGCLELTKSSDYTDDDELGHTIMYISVLTVCYNSTELTSQDTSEHTWLMANMNTAMSDRRVCTHTHAQLNSVPNLETTLTTAHQLGLNKISTIQTRRIDCTVPCH